jgi:ABC-type glycerol-3-phosphate transport system substrate-binding protein
MTALAALTVAGTLTGCASGSSTGKTTITLSGPNQFNAETSSFGGAWDKLVAGFEKENPDITLKTNVLPISSWAQASAAQLTAGTAPELIFNQTTHKPGQVKNLDSYLDKPNPFISGNKKWIDAFDPKYFGGPKQLGINVAGHHEWIPFNLVGVAIYFNKDILTKEKIDPNSLSDFDSFIKTCGVLKKAGYAPLGTDNGSLTQGWEMVALSSTIFNNVVDKLNQFDAAGNPGTANPMASKSIAKAVLTGDLNVSNSPEVESALKLLKKFNDACATPNWSGIQASGAFTGGTDFLSGKAAMAWGTNFAATNLADSKFKFGTVTFPTVSKSDTPYASGEAAQFGVSTGGTSYMIPSYIKGKELAAAVKFLQYVSSPKIQPWLDKTASIPALTGLKAPPGLSAFLKGRWSTTPVQGQGAALIEIPAALTSKNPYEGYLLGETPLDKALATFHSNNVTWAKEQVSQAGWTEPWTKG